MPSAFASFDLAIAQPSLLESTTTGLLFKNGLGYFFFLASQVPEKPPDSHLPPMLLPNELSVRLVGF